MPTDTIRQAAEWIAKASSLLVTAGAGMGVDSGLPDFRGKEGLWRAYPGLGARGLDFAAAANPKWFRHDPAFAWGFYGHRLSSYRAVNPHQGFELLRQWGAGRELRVVTSNVDGQFQKAGLTDIWEIHGSIHHLQCLDVCHEGIWPAAAFTPRTDVEAVREMGALPQCPRCGAVARPNILMFGDFSWLGHRQQQQESEHVAWLMQHAGPEMVIIECGAGTSIPSIRNHSQYVVRRFGARLIRINPREYDVPAGQIGVAGSALPVLQELDRTLRAIG